MGWRLWGSDKSEAEASLEALQHDEPTKSSGDADFSEDEIFVTLTDNPASRTPGSPLPCLNEGGPVHPGDRVQLSTTFKTQETTIVSIVRDGVLCPTLEPDERAEIILGDTADLSDVYRTACLMDPETPDTSQPGGFLVQVHTAEQRDKNVYVVGRARGLVTKGSKTVVSPWTDPDRRFAKITSVHELPDGRVGILLSQRDAATFMYGDEITSV